MTVGHPWLFLFPNAIKTRTKTRPRKLAPRLLVAAKLAVRCRQESFVAASHQHTTTQWESSTRRSPCRRTSTAHTRQRTQTAGAASVQPMRSCMPPAHVMLCLSLLIAASAPCCCDSPLAVLLLLLLAAWPLRSLLDSLLLPTAAAATAAAATAFAACRSVKASGAYLRVHFKVRPERWAE